MKHPLLDYIKRYLNLKLDCELAEILDVAPPVLSRIRHGKLKPGATILLRIHEETGIPFQMLRGLIDHID